MYVMWSTGYLLGALQITFGYPHLSTARLLVLLPLTEEQVNNLPKATGQNSRTRTGTQVSNFTSFLLKWSQCFPKLQGFFPVFTN